MDLDQTQAISLDEYEDETDEEITQSQKAPVAHLKVPCQKGVPEKLYPLYEGNNVIGRQEDCNIYIPSKALSKQHACVEIRGDSHLIYDIGSRNKTRRGKLFLSPNVRYELKHKDAIIFADVHASYIIDSQISRVEDSGSETGSESMLQTLQVTAREEGPVLDETKVNEDDASDASSDILQPTQPSCSAPSWTTSRMMEPTQKVTSDGSDEDHVNGNLTVGETPLVKRDQSDLSTLVLPESGSEEGSEPTKGDPQVTLMFEEEKDTSGDQDLLAAPTQAFISHSDTDEDEDDSKKKDLLCAATQAYGLGESGTDSEEECKVDMDAPTLAVVDDNEADEDGSEVDVNAATQAVVPVEEEDESEGETEVKTVAYDMDVEFQRKKKGSRSKKAPAPEPACAPTQAYTLDTEDAPRKKKKTFKSDKAMDPTQAYDLEAEIKNNKEESGTGPSSASTQSFSVQEMKPADKSDTEDRGLVPTQVFEEEDAEEDECAEDVSHLLTTPTLACDMEEEEDTDSELPDLDEGADVIEKETQAVGNDNATQAFEEVEEEKPAPKKVKTANKQLDEDATQVFGDNATLAVSEPCKQGKTKKVVDEDATQVFEENDATVAVNESLLKSTRVKKAQKKMSKDDATQVFGGDDEPTLVVADTADVKSGGDGDATQVFEDATQAVEDVATQVFSSDSAALAVQDNTRVKERGKSKPADDATQVFGSDDATLACSEEDADDNKKKAKTDEDATQVFSANDATLQVEEEEQDKPSNDSTQVFGEEATVALEEETEVAPKKSGRGRSKGRGRNVGKGRGKTVDNDAATLPAEEEEELSSMRRGDRERAKGREEDMVTQDETLPVGDMNATVAVEEKEEPAALRGRGRGRKYTESKAKSSTTEHKTVVTDDATLAIEEVEEPSAARGRGRGKGKKQGEGKTRKAKEADVEDQDEHKREEATQVCGKDSDSDSEDSTLPVEELVDVTGVENKSTKTKRDKASPVLDKKSKTRKPIARSPGKSSPSGTDMSDLEPTQAYGKDEPEATQVYGMDCTEEMVPESQGVEKAPSPMIPLPERSPHKSALASPRRSPSPSPKHVAFAPGVADNENKTKKSGVLGRGRGRGRGRRSLDLSVVGVDEDVRPGRRRTSAPERGIKVDEVGGRDRGDTNEKADDKEDEAVLSEKDVQSVVPKLRRKGRKDKEETAAEPAKEVDTVGRRGKKRSAPPEDDKKMEGKAEETVASPIVQDKSEAKETAAVPVGRRGRKRMAHVEKDKKEEDVTEIPTEPARGKGRKAKVPEIQQEVEVSEGSGKKKQNKTDEEEDGLKSSTVAEAPKGRGRRKTAAAEPEEKITASNQRRGKKSIVTEEKEESLPEHTSRKGRTRKRLVECDTSPLKRGRTAAKVADEDEIKPPQSLRAAVKSKTVTESSPLKDHRRRSVSLESSVSSKEGSLDDFKPAGRAGEEKTASRSASRTRNMRKNSQETSAPENTDSGRARRSQVKEEEAAAVEKTEPNVCGGKGKRQSKAAKTVSSEESQGSKNSIGSEKVSRSSVRKRTSEESVELPVPKRNKKGSKDSIDSEASSKVEDHVPTVSKRASKRTGNASKLEEPDDSSPPSAKKSKVGTKETVPADNNSRRSRSRGKSDANPQKAEISNQDVKVKVEVKLEEPDVTVGSRRKKGGKTNLTETQECDASPTKKSRFSEILSPKGRQKLVKEEVSSPSLRRKSMEPKPSVLFTGVVDEQGQKVVKDLGGDLATTIQECTHLVTDKVRRTVKFLGCLARGIPIITPHWLTSCKSAGTFLECSKFLVSDTAAEKQHKFSLKKSLSKAATENMLQGYKIHVTKSVRPEPPQMKDILVCAGGEYLPTMPKKPDGNVIVISCEEDKAICAPALKAGIPVVSSEFILTGILRQEVEVDNFRLFPADEGSSKGGGCSRTRR